MKEEKKLKGVYYKSDIIASKMFDFDTDILEVVLKDDKTYTIEEIEKLIRTYKKKVVI